MAESTGKAQADEHDSGASIMGRGGQHGDTVAFGKLLRTVDSSNPWEDYRHTVPVQAFLEATRARASRSFAGGGTRRWLTASNLELPERLVDDVARRSAPLPEEMLRPH